jgi:hypothetical protein
MKPCLEPGRYPRWTAPPRAGITRQAGDFESVKIA